MPDQEKKTLGDYFDEITQVKPESSPEVTKPSGEVEVPETIVQPEVIQETPTTVETEDVLTPTPKKDSEVNPDTSVDYKQKYEDLLAENQKDKHKMASWEGRIRKANERAAEMEDRVKQLEEKLTGDPQNIAPKEKPSTTDLTTEEDKVLQDFYDEFPDFKKPIEILAKRKAEALLDNFKDNINPTIEEIQTEVKSSQDIAHQEAITNAHPDWLDIADTGKLQAWVDAQTPIIKNALNQVIQAGTTKEVIELFDQYKKANKLPQKQEIKKDKQEAVTSKADALLAVEVSSAGPPKTAPSKDDFDSGWTEALSS